MKAARASLAMEPCQTFEVAFRSFAAQLVCQRRHGLLRQQRRCLSKGGQSQGKNHEQNESHAAL